MESHVNKICETECTHLRNIKKNRPYIAKDAWESLEHASKSLRLDSANAVVYGLPKVLIEKLQRVQKWSAQLITGSYKHDHITPVFKSLHWRPVEQRTSYNKIGVLGSKCVYGLASGYLQNLVELYTLRRTLRSSNDKITLPIPKVRALYGDRSVFVRTGETHCRMTYVPVSLIIIWKLSWKSNFFLQHIIIKIIVDLLQWMMYCLLNFLTRYIEMYLSHIHLHRFNYLVEASCIVFSFFHITLYHHINISFATTKDSSTCKQSTMTSKVRKLGYIRILVKHHIITRLIAMP